MCSVKAWFEPWQGGLPLAVLLTTCLVCAPGSAPAATREMAAERRAPAAGVPVALEQAHFSDLDELTPQNVGELLPLLAVPGAFSDARRGDSPPPAGRVPVAQARPDARSGSAAQPPDSALWHVTLVRAALPQPRQRALNSTVSYLVAETTGGDRAGTRADAGNAGRLSAWDPVHRRVVWTAAETVPAGSGALVTAGGLVFYCSSDGWLQALDAQSGRQLWTHRLAGGEHGPPFTYLGADGHQYVGLLTGIRGDSGTLQTFSLPR